MLPVRVVTLDTGRLFQETYDLMDRTRAMYPGLEFETYFPAAESLEAFVNSQGMSSIFKSVEARKTCCGIRKIDPLHRALEGAEVWVTGECSKVTTAQGCRAWNGRHVRQAEVQSAAGLVRRRPRHLRQLHSVPTNPLHRKGYPSIGCAPCTRAVMDGEHPAPAGGGGSNPPKSAACTRVIPRMGHL